MEVVTEQRVLFGVKPTCMALGIPRASYYRLQRLGTGPREVRQDPRALSTGLDGGLSDP